VAVVDVPDVERGPDGLEPPQQLGAADVARRDAPPSRSEAAVALAGPWVATTSVPSGMAAPVSCRAGPRSRMKCQSTEGASESDRSAVVPVAWLARRLVATRALAASMSRRSISRRDNEEDCDDAGRNL